MNYHGACSGQGQALPVHVSADRAQDRDRGACLPLTKGVKSSGSDKVAFNAWHGKAYWLVLSVLAESGGDPLLHLTYYYY